MPLRVNCDGCPLVVVAGAEEKGGGGVDCAGTGYPLGKCGGGPLA